MKFIELFAGIGGLGYGLMKAGMECVGFVEWDKYAHKAFKLLHDPEERMWEGFDITTVTDDDIRLLGRERGPIQVISGGFPCQAFSIAGKREGFADQTRGTLFFEIIRFASILRPKYLLLENVTGLLSHDGGRTFATILLALDELGYDCEWNIFNSAAYVPQNRERVFVVGHSRNGSRRKIFPFGEQNSEIVKSIGNVNPSGNGMNGKVYDSNGLAPTLTTNKGEGNKIILEPIPCLTPDREEKRQNGRRFKEPGEPMFTLTAQDKHGVYDGYRIRKLTPLECFRLQSWPDEWYHTLKQNGMSDSQLYKQAGNGVTSVVAYEIAKRIMEGEHAH